MDDILIGVGRAAIIGLSVLWTYSLFKARKRVLAKDEQGKKAINFVTGILFVPVAPWVLLALLG